MRTFYKVKTLPIHAMGNSIKNEQVIRRTTDTVLEKKISIDNQHFRRHSLIFKNIAQLTCLFIFYSY